MSTRTNSQFLMASLTEFVSVWATGGLNQIHHQQRCHYRRIQLHPWSSRCAPLHPSFPSSPFPCLPSSSSASSPRASQKGNSYVSWKYLQVQSLWGNIQEWQGHQNSYWENAQRAASWQGGRLIFGSISCEPRERGRELLSSSGQLHHRVWAKRSPYITCQNKLQLWRLLQVI